MRITSDTLALQLKSYAKHIGADLVAIAPATELEQAKDYDQWVEHGMHGSMDYLSKNKESRHDLRNWYAQAQSVLICGFSYGGITPKPKPGDGRIARYAVYRDYHPLLKSKMENVLGYLKTILPDASGKAFCDTSPLLERAYSRVAGLGWQGKNTMLISPQLGSYFLLAGLALNVSLPPDEPEADHCGSCRRCIDACPTEAFPKEYVLDASRCIAYFTIEHKGTIAPEFRKQHGNWIFGCDICQEVCPWNRFERKGTALSEAAIEPQMPLEDFIGLDAKEFKQRFGDLPVMRTKQLRMTRNVLLAMGNSGEEKFRPYLEQNLNHPDSVIAEQAQWSASHLRAQDKLAKIKSS